MPPIRYRLIGRANWLSKLARWEGLRAGRALHSPSRPQATVGDPAMALDMVASTTRNEAPEFASMPRWVMYGRCPRCKRNLTISEAFGCGHVFGLLSLGGLPLSRCSRYGRWP